MIRLIFFLLLALPLAASAQSEVCFGQSHTDQNRVGLTTDAITLVQSVPPNQLRVQGSGASASVPSSRQGISNLLDVEVTGTGNHYDFPQSSDNNVAQGATWQNTSPLNVLRRGQNFLLIQKGTDSTTGLLMRIEQMERMRILLGTCF